jgi:hypothetical protein
MVKMVRIQILSPPSLEMPVIRGNSWKLPTLLLPLLMTERLLADTTINDREVFRASFDFS